MYLCRTASPASPDRSATFVRHGRACRRPVALMVLLALAGGSSAAGAAGSTASPQGSPTPAGTAASAAPAKADTALSWETGAGKSYAIPAIETIGYLVLLNQYDRQFGSDPGQYRTDFGTIWDHFRKEDWVVDTDRFATNQFLHPYSGTVYYTLARSTGLNFWESLLYAGAGSFLWEIGGETNRPSVNDQIFTTFGGTFFGEPLFRMANLLLESGGEHPQWWRELGAAAISPAVGFNRLVFGNRFDTVYPSRDPAIFGRLEVGGTLSGTSHNVSSNAEEDGAFGRVSFDYGLPGKPGYAYERPFDYFSFQLVTVTSNAIESILSRGLLYGADYRAGKSTRGAWGLYGSYDYVSPQVFRVSSAALSAGTTWQTWLSDHAALQGTALLGAGYGAAGSVHPIGNRDYHYGTTPQALLALRLILGDRVMIDLESREYYVSDLASPKPHGWENIARGDLSLAVRVWRRHGIGLRYAISHRDAKYANVAYRNESVGTLSLAYVFFGQTDLGAVDWR